MAHDLRSRWRSCWGKFKEAEECVRSTQNDNDKLRRQIKILKNMIVEFEMSQIHWSGRYSIGGNSNEQKDYVKKLFERLDIAIIEKKRYKMSKQQRISVEQYVEITDWCRNNKYRIETTKHTQLAATTLAEIELGYVVPITTIQRCAKIAKIKWAKSPTPPPPVPLEREAIIILMGAIAGLYVETGKTVPTELANLQSTYVREEKEVI